ncbi:MAG: response regulator [Planctomycetota bacterium]
MVASPVALRTEIRVSVARSVLIIEDNPALAESMSFALSTFGWTVEGPATSADAARAALKKERFSIAILDVDLGNEYSWPIARQLREAGIPFAFVTGLADDEDVPEEFQNEVRLLKPVMPEALVEVLDGLLERASA